MWWETYNISWIFCDHLKSSPYHHPISTVQVELVDEKAGSVYTVSFHQMILFGFSRFCVNLCIILFGFFELVIFAKLHFASQGARLRPLQILGWQSIWKVRASHFKKQVGNLSENKPNLSSLVWIKVNSGVEAEFKRTPDDGEIKWKRKSSDQCFPLSFDFWPGCYCRKW